MTTQTLTRNSRSNNRSAQGRGNRNGFRRHHEDRMPLDPLVLEALDFINTHADNSRVYKCFHKNRTTGVLESFGVYNSKNKKHAIFYTVNFFPEDFNQIKRVTLEK